MLAISLAVLGAFDTKNTVSGQAVFVDRAAACQTPYRPDHT